MKAIATTATVTADGKITVQLPPDISAGEHEVVVVVNEKLRDKEKRSSLKFSAYPVGLILERRCIQYYQTHFPTVSTTLNLNICECAEARVEDSAFGLE